MEIIIPREIIGLAILKFERLQLFSIVISLFKESLFMEIIEETKKEIGKI